MGRRARPLRLRGDAGDSRRKGSSMKRILVLSALVTGLGVALSAAAAPNQASLVIRHQLHGCHAWALNGGAFKVVQAVRITRGGSIVVTNNDVMYHQFVKVSGPAVTYTLLKPGTAMKGTVRMPFKPGMMG